MTHRLVGTVAILVMAAASTAAQPAPPEDHELELGGGWIHVYPHAAWRRRWMNVSGRGFLHFGIGAGPMIFQDGLGPGRYSASADTADTSAAATVNCFMLPIGASPHLALTAA